MPKLAWINRAGRSRNAPFSPLGCSADLHANPLVGDQALLRFPSSKSGREAGSVDHCMSGT